jgi:hypothetical protein
MVKNCSPQVRRLRSRHGRAAILAAICIVASAALISCRSDKGNSGAGSDRNVSVDNSPPVEMACAEFMKSPPTHGRVKITGAVLDLGHSDEYSSDDDLAKGHTVAQLHCADDADMNNGTSSPAVIVGTDDPKLAEAVRKMKSNPAAFYSDPANISQLGLERTVTATVVDNSHGSSTAVHADGTESAINVSTVTLEEHVGK